MNSTELVLHLNYAERILEGLDCPRALTVCIMLRYGDFEGIVSLRSEPENFNDAASFFSHHSATKLLSKAKWLPLKIDRRRVALEKFHQAEHSNDLMNKTLKAIRSGSASWLIPGFEHALTRVRKETYRIVSKGNWLSALDQCGFGPGADISTKSGLTSAYNKLQGPQSVTRACTKFLDFYVQNSRLASMFQWSIDDRSLICERVPGNKVTVVPKNAKTDRVIAVEPRWNVYFQKGFGLMLRTCLLRSGQDLRTQLPNQQLAQIGSDEDTFATIDLASASDSVSLELVRELLPQGLTHLLELCRSNFAFLDGEWVENHKFSSMGNGYTFELETIIFLAVVRSICGQCVSVYGDDIIVPSSRAPEVLETLYMLGFRPNQEKSFSTGPFRESCGGDFFLGSLVTPIYWKEPLNVQGTIGLVNQVAILADRRAGHGFNRDLLDSLRKQLAKRLPASFQKRGPYSSSTMVGTHSREWDSYTKWGWDGVFLRGGLKVQAIKIPYRNFEAAVTSSFLQPFSHGYQVRGRTRLVWSKSIFVNSREIVANDELFHYDQLTGTID